VAWCNKRYHVWLLRRALIVQSAPFTRLPKKPYPQIPTSIHIQTAKLMMLDRNHAHSLRDAVKKKAPSAMVYESPANPRLALDSKR